MAKRTDAFRRNNQIIENSEFDFGTNEQRSDTQTFVNEKGSRMKTGINAIDSDDEEENKIQEKKTKYKKLDMKKVQGLEDDPDEGLMDAEGNMVTGFNLKDDLEDGEFDSTGQFHFRKEKKDDRDEWLDTVDWKEIKKAELAKKEKSAKADFAEPEEIVRSDKAILSEILTYVLPKETVTKALQRLGTVEEKLPAWKQKRLDALKRRQGGKKSTSSEKTTMPPPAGNDKEKLGKLTQLVDQLSRGGYYDIYTDTYEKMRYKLNQLDERTDAGDDMDMFGDSSSKTLPSDSKLEQNSVKWEYKLTQDGDLVGPMTTTAMIKLQGGSNPNILCRRVNTINFYNIKRVDFELYD